MKIAYSIGHIGNSGGIERVISTKANYLADIFEYEVHIIVGRKQPDSLFYHFSDKIIFHYLDLEDHACHGRMYRRKLTQVLFEIKPDITISTFGQDAAFLYKIKDGSKKVLEFHFSKNYLVHLGESLQNDRLRWIRWLWLRFLQRRETYLANKYDQVVLLTEKDKQLWGGGDKFTVIPNPLSFESTQTAPLENKRILAMGRLMLVQKGFQYLIRAFNLLHNTYPDWEIYIYGEGRDKKYLQELINDLSLQNNIHIMESTEAVEQVMMEASIFVFPSLYEGFGLVLTEAMTCGVPCIAFDCECGPSEIIKENTDGLLVQVKNETELAEKMAVLMNDENLRRQMGAFAKENVLRFSPDVIMNKWNKYFTEIIAKN